MIVQVNDAGCCAWHPEPYILYPRPWAHLSAQGKAPGGSIPGHMALPYGSKHRLHAVMLARH